VHQRERRATHLVTLYAEPLRQSFCERGLPRSDVSRGKGRWRFSGRRGIVRELCLRIPTPRILEAETPGK
jgi:hypothetical protein